MRKMIFPLISDVQKQLPLYMTSCGLFYEESFLTRPSGFPDYQWIQTISGQGRYKDATREYMLTENQGMLLFPNIPHSYEAIGHWETHWVSFDGYGVHTILKNLNVHKSSFFTLPNSSYFINQFENLSQLASMPSQYQALELSSVLLQFLIQLVKEGIPFEKDALEKAYSKLYPVLKFVDQHYMETMTLEELSNQISVTPQYLCQLFKTLLQKRPFEYINEIRISKSKELIIRHPEIPIQKICQMVGYENPSYFNLQFKKYVQMSPLTFRNIHHSIG